MVNRKRRIVLMVHPFLLLLIFGCDPPKPTKTDNPPNLVVKAENAPEAEPEERLQRFPNEKIRIYR
jgi:hypothetical protein